MVSDGLKTNIMRLFLFFKRTPKKFFKKSSIDKVLKIKINFTFTVHSRSTHGKKILVHVTFTSRSRHAHAKVPRTGEMLYNNIYIYIKFSIM
jgi:hypothetical protein